MMMMDPEVSHWLGTSPAPEPVFSSIDRFEANLEAIGDGFLALQRRDDLSFIGTAELMPINPQFPLPPGHQVGWRLARHAWGKGYASEAGQALLKFGFDTLALKEIVAFTAETNTRSRGVMERIGMRRAATLDFDNPFFLPNDQLRHHVVYAAVP